MSVGNGKGDWDRPDASEGPRVTVGNSAPAGDEFLRAVLAAAAKTFRSDGWGLIGLVDGMPPMPPLLETVANTAGGESGSRLGSLPEPSSLSIASVGQPHRFLLRLDDLAQPALGPGGRSGECLDVQKLRLAALAYEGTTAARDRAVDAFEALQTVCLAALPPKGHA